MNKYIYIVGSFALAFLMSGAPVIALAENGNDEGQVRVQAQATDASVSVTSARDESGDEQTIGEQGNRPEVNASDEQADDESLEDEDLDEQDELDLELEDDEDTAFSLEDLKQKIEERKQELEDEEASTTPKHRDIVKNANPVRLAVHALLASRDLLGGGIGQQVSEIAKEMNDSVASTTNAEAKIQSRGFLIRFFFGGDSTLAEMIAEETSRNQENIQKLTDLLNQAGATAEVKAMLTAQITVLEAAQARLEALAEREQKAWGLFSWRF